MISSNVSSADGNNAGLWIELDAILAVVIVTLAGRFLARVACYAISVDSVSINDVLHVDRPGHGLPARRHVHANGRHKLARLDEAIELWLAGSAGLKSRLERAFLGLVIHAGLSKPIPNTHVAGAEADAWWPDLRLVAEIDGPNHTRPPSRRADGSRDRLLAEAGVTVLRFTEFDVERRHVDVVAALVRAGCR